MNFEQYTTERIAKLRDEATALEKVLKEYQALNRTYSSVPTKPGGGFGAVMDAVQAAGPAGIDLDEMMEAAAAADMPVKRNTLRSQLWQAKDKGRIIPMGPGRYRWPDIDEVMDAADRDRGDGGGARDISDL